MLIMQFGVCISYIIFFIDFLELAIYSEKDNISHGIYFALIAILFLVPLTFIDNMSFFSKTSTIANGLILITLAVITIQALTNSIENESSL